MIKRKLDEDKTYFDAMRQRNINPDRYRDVCDLKYLTETMGGNKKLIKEIMDVFLKQVPQDLSGLNGAVSKLDYLNIKSFAHTLKSSVSIMGISVLAPILYEMEELAKGAASPDRYRDEKIKKLNNQLNSICKQAIEEIEKEKHN